MKEYINKTTGEYRKTSEVVSGEQWIEVLDGADLYGRNKLSGVKEFYKINPSSHYIMTLNADGVWIKSRYHIGNIEYLWTRPSQPEALPFVNDEPSLNDQYAEIEKVRQFTVADTLAARQATYGSFEDVACVTQDLLAILKRTGLDSLPKPHKEALHMICSKMARIVNGDHNHSDSWHDIGGYAKLIEDLID